MSSLSRVEEPLAYGAVAFDFVDRLTKMRSSQDIVEATRRILMQFGFDWFVMSSMPQDFEDTQPLILLMDLPESWPEHYLANAYHKVDPVAHACRIATHPIEWHEVTPLPQARRQSAEVMNRAGDVGMKFGLTLPIHPIDGGVCCFSMSASRKPYLDSHTKPAIHLMGAYAFDRARELSRPSAPEDEPRLTRREREVLTWAAVGKSASMIAEILSISERTAIAHTVNATHKLGAANKTAAVARALQKRLISL